MCDIEVESSAADIVSRVVSPEEYKEFFPDVSLLGLSRVRTLDLDDILNLHSAEVTQLERDLVEETKRLNRCLACVACSSAPEIIFGCGKNMVENSNTRIFVLKCRLERLQ